jgi:hypothetical protein
MAIFPYRYYVDSDPNVTRLDLFEFKLQDDPQTTCYLVTTFLQTDRGIEELYQLHLPPRFTLTVQNIAKIVGKVLPPNFTYDLRALPKTHVSCFLSLNNDYMSSDIRWKLGSVVLANRLLESFNQLFLSSTKELVFQMKAGCRQISRGLHRENALTLQEAKKKLNEIILCHVNPLKREFTEYLRCVPTNRLTQLIQLANSLMDDIRQAVQGRHSMNKLCNRLIKTLIEGRASQKSPEYRIIMWNLPQVKKRLI